MLVLDRGSWWWAEISASGTHSQHGVILLLKAAHGAACILGGGCWAYEAHGKDISETTMWMKFKFEYSSQNRAARYQTRGIRSNKGA